MDIDEAVAELAASIEAPSYAPDADAIRAVLARLVELESGEVTTEWGVRWITRGEIGHAEIAEVEIHDDDRRSAEIAARVNAGEFVQREVRTWRGPWIAVGGEA